jgi:NAD(P)-dependent dehydrogenase (short-subunit alcohol dehydrogenase family)
MAVVVDHTVPEAVRALFEQVRAEQGRLDVLVNDVWGGDELAEWGRPFWEQDPRKGWLMQERAVFSHILTSQQAAPLMIGRRQGLIVEITDGDSPAYRGNLFYDLAKASVIRLALGMAEELKHHAITALALTPGFLRSEAMLEHFGVSEANWREGAQKEPHFIASESPFYVGRAVAALAADAHVNLKSGRVFSSWNLAKEYGFTDLDGSRPDWGAYFKTIGP